MFKGFQCLSSGVLLSISGMIEYYACVQSQDCGTMAPGISQGVWLPVSDVIGSCILVWGAFLLLPCSHAAGKRSYSLKRDLTSNLLANNRGSASDGGEHVGPVIYAGRGGRLRALLMYDVYCFLASCVL